MLNSRVNNYPLYYFLSKFNTINANTYNTEIEVPRIEDQNIFSPINPTNIQNLNILELSSLKNENTKTFYGVKVKKIQPNLSTNFFTSKANNINPNKKTLVLDLDETLVHSSTEAPFPKKKNIELNLKIKNTQYKIYVIIRPFLEYFLKEMSSYYNLFIFTASMSQYAKALLDILDKEKLIIKTFNREHCQYKFGLYLKDLSIFNVDYKDIIIIDNNPVSYALNKSNGIPILTWIDDPNDRELIKLIPFLKYLANVDDVREVIKKVVNISKSKVNFTLLNKILKKHEEIDLVLNNAMNKNILYGTRTLKNNTGNNSSKFKLEVKDDINLFPKDKKTKNNSYISIIDEEISKRINTQKIVNKTKNVINQGNQGKEMLIIDNDIKEKNKNKNNEYTFQKLKVKKFIKEQIPQDKIKINDKSKNKNSRPNVYNISIGNIKNIQNNIKIILKDKNKIVVSKVEKPKLGKLKQLKLDMSGINIDNKKKVKNGINETNPFDIFTENNIKFSRSNVLKTEHINTSKSINLNSNLNNIVDKKPLDKNEYEIKGIKNRNIFYFPSNINSKNHQKKKELNTIKTDIFFNNILRKNDNNKYLNINESLKPPLKNKLIVMKIIKKITNNNSNNASKIKFKKSE